MPYADKEKQIAYQLKWILARRAKFFDGKSCVRCNSTKKLELDHINPETKVSHHIWSWSKVRQDEEIRKCQVLCRLCHIEKTREEITVPLVHGTTSGYHKGCRCKPCTSATSKQKAEWRKRVGRH